jgi:antitoxin VapB
MTAVAKLFNTGGSQAVRLPKEFRFPGKTVMVRRTKKGVVELHPHNDPDSLREKLRRLAGSCPDFPLRAPVRGKDTPRDLAW